MLLGRKVAFAAAAMTGLMFGSAASAADANLSDCVHMAKQVSAAIGTAQPGKAKDDAVVEQHAGQSYCGFSMYAQGVAHYAKALQLLGQQQSKG